MGNRKKGNPKKKSIKVALSSNASSKRKLSRMGKKRKKGLGGLEATLIGRSRCIKKLQIDLKDFRRLCILKGIYPREPHGRAPGNKKSQSYYHIKDIKAIAHEPVLQKFREFKSFMKKVRRAAGRNEIDEANRKNSLLPTYSLHHLVKERYPRFIDALADIDDALTLTYLFAALPAEGSLRSDVINKAKSLAAAWGAYCSTTSCITKSFISIKGVYLEATIQNVPIRWIVPHSFTQYIPEDINFRIMQTFMEFYETMLNFIMFKLYSDIGVRYPFSLKDLGSHVFGSTSALLGANLRALTNARNASFGTIGNIVSQTAGLDTSEAPLNHPKSRYDTKQSSHNEVAKSVGMALTKLAKHTNEEDDDEDAEDNDGVDVASPLRAALESITNEELEGIISGGSEGVDDDKIKRKRLYAGLTFFLSREIPRGYLELVCLAYGGKVGWEGDDSPISMKDSSITHHIVDRPQLPSSYESLPKSREFIQPQWIVDCANFMFLLPIERYSVGVSLPPHLSPWVDDEEEGYKPAYAEEIDRLKNGEIIESQVEVESAARGDIPEKDNAQSASSSDERSDEEEESDDASKVEPRKDEDVDDMEVEPVHGDKGEEASSEEEDDDDDDIKAKLRAERKRRKEDDEAHSLAKTMMNRKAAHLYGRMQHGIARKKAKVEMLTERRKAIEDNIEGEAASNKKALTQKQKVERLKKERRSIENDYADTGGSMKKKSKSKK